MDVSITIQTQNPAGTILDLAGSTIPFGYLACDGSLVSRVTFPRLFDAIGTTHGAGDGTTTFRLPDTRGRALIGSGTGSSLSARTLAAIGGTETHTLTESEMPSHTHTQNSHAHGVTDPGHTHSVARPNGSGSGFALDGVVSTTPMASGSYVYSSATGISINSATPTNQNTGGSSAHNNMQPFLVATKVIKF